MRKGSEKTKTRDKGGHTEKIPCQAVRFDFRDRRPSNPREAVGACRSVKERPALSVRAQRFLMTGCKVWLEGMLRQALLRADERLIRSPKRRKHQICGKLPGARPHDRLWAMSSSLFVYFAAWVFLGLSRGGRLLSSCCYESIDEAS